MQTLDNTSTARDEIEVRSPVEGDRPGLVRLDEAAFGYTTVGPDPGPWIEAYDGPYAQVAVADGQIVGGAAAFPMRVTLPGGAVLDCPGVTSVAVLPTHRRRGILREMMNHQLVELRRGGAALAGLVATEATIYERFGWGAATRYAQVEVDTRRVVFRVPPTGGSMRLLTPKEAVAILPSVHEAAAASRPGMTTRPEPMWRHFFRDLESDRGGRSGLFHVVHLQDGNRTDGYASYRVEEVETSTGFRNIVNVEQLVGLDPTVEMELWRFVCSIDLADRVRARVAVDHPLWSYFEDRRAVSTIAVSDHLWMRVIDLVAVLGARRYGRDGELVVGSVDWELTNNIGQFRLVVENGQAAVTRTQDRPDIVVDIAGLGALVLGGIDARHLVLTGRMQGDAQVTNQYFRGDVEPWCDVDF
jgi:predicted acetyltransferase